VVVFNFNQVLHLIINCQNVTGCMAYFLN